MNHKKKERIIKKIQDLEKEVALLSTGQAQQRQILQTAKLLFLAAQILEKKDLITIEKKAGEKH